MDYISTRNGIAPITFCQAVMMGLATDGGLILPKTIPVIAPATLKEWSQLSFQQLALEIMRLFVGHDLSEDELKGLIDRSFATFSHRQVTPVIQVGEQHILELFHGPTLAFKDVALQFLGNLFEHILAKSGEVLNILGATSGDTGSAAIHGVRGKKGIRIFILHPYRKVSLVQEKQMTTVLDANVHNIAIRGNFDDGQNIVKTLFNDIEYKQSRHLGAVNSINWARILAQVVYYFYAWGKVTSGDVGQKKVFSVPTGNFGDIFAGFVAYRMGLPIERLLLATNRNDILARFFKTGVYAPTQAAEATWSPSMDIQVASNFERYIYYLLGENGDAVAHKMSELKKSGCFSVGEEEKKVASQLFSAVRVEEKETLSTIRTTYEQHGYLLDPHTAVGVAAAKNSAGAICLATAHPAKFGAAVKEAIGKEPELVGPLAGILDKPSRMEVLDADVQQIRTFMDRHIGY